MRPLFLLFPFLLASFTWAQDQQVQIFPITDVAPDYPREAIIREVEGWVLVSFDVSSEGSVSNINVRDSQPMVTFDQAAIEAAEEFRFNPYIENGVAKDVSGIEYIFRFELSESAEMEVPNIEISLNDAAVKSRIPRALQRRPSITQIANEEMIPVSTTAPSYPVEAQNEKIGGWVLLRFSLTDEGAVLDPTVEDSEPAGVFDESALRAIKEFQYEPWKTSEGTFDRLNVFHLFKFRPAR
jgi:TonB family protein